MGDNKLTSVKVNEELFEEFKVLCVRTKFSLQKLGTFPLRFGPSNAKKKVAGVLSLKHAPPRCLGKKAGTLPE